MNMFRQTDSDPTKAKLPQHIRARLTLRHQKADSLKANHKTSETAETKDLPCPD